MKSKLLETMIPIFITSLLLIIFEILMASIFPALGMKSFKLPFNVLFILFIGFYFNSAYSPLLIMLIEIVHSAFSIENWGQGTIAGLVVCFVISYVKELLHFESKLITIFIVQIFMICWFIVTSLFLYIQTSSIIMVWNRFLVFIPESLVLSLMSPFVFSLLRKIWKRSETSEGVEV